MKIRFKKTDPRAGQEVELDDYRARELIDAGSAEAVGGTKAEAPAANKAVEAAPENKGAAAKRTPKKAE